MLAYDDYLTNSTDTGLRMCACEIGPKLHLTSILSKAQIPGQAQASPRAKKAHLAATQEEENQPMRNATSAIQGKLLSTNQTQARGSMDPHVAAKPT